MPERPAFVNAIAPDFRAGAGVGGDLGALLYGAGVFASSRVLDRDVFARGAFAAARLVAEPIGPVGRCRGAAPRRSVDRLVPVRGRRVDPVRHAAGGAHAGRGRRLVRGGGGGSSRPANTCSRHTCRRATAGAYVEPGLSVEFTGRLDVTARVAWARAADTNDWSGGLALTAYTRVPALRVQAGIEQRSGGCVTWRSSA